MRYLSLSIPGFGNIDSGLPTGVPTGGLFDKVGDKVIAGTGINAVWVGIELVLIGAIFLSLFFIGRGGVNMITSGGDKQKFQTGRERVRYAIIGLIIIFLSFFGINIIGSFFGYNLLSFSK